MVFNTLRNSVIPLHKDRDKLRNSTKSITRSEFHETKFDEVNCFTTDPSADGQIDTDQYFL